MVAVAMPSQPNGADEKPRGLRAPTGWSESESETDEPIRAVREASVSLTAPSGYSDTSSGNLAVFVLGNESPSSAFFLKVLCMCA